MSELKPIAVSKLNDVDKFLFESATDLLSCEQVAAGYNGMIVDLIQLRAESTGRLDALNSWCQLWAHICTVTNCADYLPSEANFDAMIEKVSATVTKQTAKCKCVCGCDSIATKQDEHGKPLCEQCYNDYYGIAAGRDDAERTIIDAEQT